MKRYPVPRPTENAAIAHADRSRPRAHATEELFVALVHAYAVDDRYGLRLFGLQVVRATGGPLR